MMKYLFIISCFFVFNSFSQTEKAIVLDENESCKLLLINKDTLTFGENRIKIKLKNKSATEIRLLSFGAQNRKTASMSEFIINIPTKSPNLIWILVYINSLNGAGQEILRFKINVKE